MSATATAAAEPREGRAARERGRLPGRWAWPAGYAVAAVLLFLCYLRLSGTQAVTSDPASNALQAWDMLHGNWLLRGWTLTDVSFLTTELPEFMLVEILRGLGPADAHIAAALTYTLLVLLAGLVAKGRTTGTEGLVRVLIAAGIMIAPQVGPGVFILLNAPDHTGTGVPVLLTWLVLDRAPRRRWLPAAIGVLLAWTLIADQVALLTAVVPLLLVTLTSAYRNVIRRGEPVGDSWFDLSLAAAAVAAVAVADLITVAIKHLGGYVTQPTPSVFSGLGQLSTHFLWTVQGVLALFGADFFGLSLDASTGLVLLHLVGLALGVAAVVLGVRRFLRSDDMIAGVLTAAVVINLALYAVSQVPVSIWSGREIAFILPASAALAGRTLAGPAIRARLVPLLGIVGLGYLLSLGSGLTKAQQPAEGQDLANFLVAHHLTYGISGYGFGPTTTLASGGQAELRQATWLPDQVSRGPEEWDASWYDPARHDATFVVAPVRPLPPDPFTEAQVIQIFGAPEHVYRVGAQFIVMTYDYNLLDRIQG